MKTFRTPYLTLIFTLLITGLCCGQGYQVGDVASDFELPSVDGQNISLADYPGAKGFILVFTCNTCPYAKAYESRIMDLDRKFASRGFPVIAINPNNPELQPGDSFEAMKERARERGYTFPYLLDKGQKVYPKYGATRTPHVFILQRSEGEVRVRYIGTIDDNYQDAAAVKTRYVEQAVEALLKGDEVPLETTRAIGCSIKA
jgi:peroxiredoxin